MHHLIQRLQRCVCEKKNTNVTWMDCRPSSVTFPNVTARAIKLRARAHWPLCSTTCGRALWRTHKGDMWRRHVCYVCKRSVCGGDEPQPVAHLSHKLQCARQSLKIMVSYGNKYPRHKARPHVVEQSGQCARALTVQVMRVISGHVFMLG